MKRSRFTEEQIIRILKEGKLGGKIDELCRRYNISKATYYSWRSKFVPPAFFSWSKKILKPEGFL